MNRVLITSTSEVYGTAKYVPIDKKRPYQGLSFYYAIKTGADRLAELFYRSFDLPVAILCGRFIPTARASPHGQSFPPPSHSCVRETARSAVCWAAMRRSAG